MTQSKGKKPLIVMKFGGTSVGSPERMKCAAELIAGHSKQAEVVAVVSAMGGVTDLLIKAANQAAQGDREHSKGVRQDLARKHREVADQLLTAAEQVETLQNKLFEEGNSQARFGFQLFAASSVRGRDLG